MTAIWKENEDHVNVYTSQGKKSPNFIYEIYFHPFCRNLMSNTDELEGNVGEDRRF